jgi:acyl-coenzyme A synthetase/AMP-(fatty) acid ligase
MDDIAPACVTAPAEPAGHADPRVADRRVCVTRYLIDDWAKARPDQDYVLFENGDHWSYVALRDRVIAVAVGLQSLGVRQGDHVAVIAPTPGHLIDKPALVDFLVARMSDFMIPRYIRVLDELPKTPSAKVRKAELRAEGITADTWDREAAGIRLRRDRL